MFQYADRPLSITQVWKTSFNLYKTTFSKIWYWAVILELIIGGSGLMAVALSSNASLKSHSTMFIVRGMITIVILALAALYFYLIPLNRMHQLAITPNESLKNSFKLVHQKYWTCLLNAIYVVLLTLLLALVFVITYLIAKLGIGGLIIALLILVPGVFVLFIVSFSLIFVWPLILFENNSAWAALEMGIKLVWRNTWRVIGMSIPIIVISILVAALKKITQLNPQNNTLLVITAIAYLVINAFIYMPLLWALALVQLNDLKLRKKMAVFPTFPGTTATSAPSAPQQDA